MISRIRLFFNLAVFGLLATPFAASATTQERARPHVLFIALDDLNDWTGFLGGHPQSRTPAMDALAKRGMIFTRAYCNAPACNPSRASMLCARRPSSTGVYHNDQPWRPVMADAVTLPQHFRRAGYRVAGGGKIFHNSYNDPQSWETWRKPGNFPNPAVIPANGIPNSAHFDWGAVTASDAQMGDTKTVNWACEVLAAPRDRPLFLAVGLIRPHLPWYVPQPYFDMFPLKEIRLPLFRADDLDDVPFAGQAIAKPQGDHAKVIKHQQWEKAVQGYLAAIAYADGQIGRLIAALDASPEGKNTIIVLWGDHGWHLGEKSHWRKFALWERATRVPLIVIAPGVTKPGQSSPRTVSLMDITPTLLELAGLPPDPAGEARSLVPLLRDPQTPWDHPALTTHGKDNHAVRNERWRYIRYADGSEELYDHQTDPNEWTNRARNPNPEAQAAIAALKPHLPAVNAPNAPTVKENGER